MYAIATNRIDIVKHFIETMKISPKITLSDISIDYLDLNDQQHIEARCYSICLAMQLKDPNLTILKYILNDLSQIWTLEELDYLFIEAVKIEFD